MNKGSSNVFAFAVAASVLVVGARPVAAQSNIAAAAKAFSLGQQAELGGNNRAASEHYELADRMVPSPEALRSAARARLKAGDEAMAATHAEALERRYSDEKSHQIAEEILEAVRPKLARISLSCDTPCGVVVDGGAVSVEEATSHVFYVEPGRHTIGADFGDGVIAQEVFEGQAGKEASISIATPEAARETPAGADVGVTSPAPPPPAPRGLKIGWFIGGAAVTVALAGVTVWSGLDVQSKNTAYEDEPTQDKLDEGRSAELRTNILIGATGVSAIATGIIAWKTRWRSPKRETGSTVQIVPAEGGAVFVLGGRFQ